MKASTTRLSSIGIYIGIVLFLIWPLISHFTPIYTPLATEILILSLFGLAYNVCLGYTGLLSLGHAAFFGVGGYTTGYLIKFLHMPLVIGVLGGVFAALMIGAFMGYICLRKSGVYFSLVTLAFAQMFYYVAQMWTGLTGGHEGMSGIPNVYFIPGIKLTNNSNLKYWIIGCIVIACGYAIWRITRSSFGRVLEAIRENEERAMSCGFDVSRIKWISMVISAGFSGLAGGLYLAHLEFFGIENIFWSTSAIVLIISLFGGTTVFMGPCIGAFIFLFMKDTLSVHFEYWQIVTGILFIGIVLFLPEGILGSIIHFAKRMTETKESKQSGQLYSGDGKPV